MAYVRLLNPTASRPCSHDPGRSSYEIRCRERRGATAPPHASGVEWCGGHPASETDKLRRFTYEVW
jgi:hypothetical protein